MGRVNRRKKPLGVAAIEPGSTRWQRLMWGAIAFGRNGPDFEDDTAKRNAWFACRDGMLAECGPGLRPAAYFEFDLKMSKAPCRWFEQIEALDSRGLINESEARGVERMYEFLAADQNRAVFSSFDHPSKDATKSIISRFDMAAGWHRRRGRDELAELYTRRAAVARNGFQSLTVGSSRNETGSKQHGKRNETAVR